MIIFGDGDKWTTIINIFSNCSLGMITLFLNFSNSKLINMSTCKASKH